MQRDGLRLGLGLWLELVLLMHCPGRMKWLWLESAEFACSETLASGISVSVLEQLAVSAPSR